MPLHLGQDLLHKLHVRWAVASRINEILCEGQPARFVTVQGSNLEGWSPTKVDWKIPAEKTNIKLHKHLTVLELVVFLPACVETDHMLPKSSPPTLNDHLLLYCCSIRI